MNPIPLSPHDVPPGRHPLLPQKPARILNAIIGQIQKLRQSVFALRQEHAWLTSEILVRQEQVREYRELVQRLQALADVEKKTSLLECEAFKRRLADRLRRAAAKHDDRAAWSSLWFLDIRDFKRINDELTHEGADQILKRVALLIKEHIRSDTATRREDECDLHGRLGGDEFFIFMPGASDAAEISAIADRFRRAIASHTRPVIDGGEGIPIEVDIGVVRFCTAGETFLSENGSGGWEGFVDELIFLASRLMLDAKREAKTRRAGGAIACKALNCLFSGTGYRMEVDKKEANQQQTLVAA